MQMAGKNTFEHRVVGPFRCFEVEFLLKLILGFGQQLRHFPIRLQSRKYFSSELARRYREFRGNAEIVLLKDLGADRASSRGHDGPELYESAALLTFLLAD
jgi:hypothetical protein